MTHWRVGSWLGAWALLCFVASCASHEDMQVPEVTIKGAAGSGPAVLQPSPVTSPVSSGVTPPVTPAATPAAPLPSPMVQPGPAPAVMPAPPPVSGTTNMPVAGAPMAMAECGLHTKYAGDEYCILPPPPDKGFQLHIGPSNYENPEPQYILQAGQEITNDFSATSTNDKEVYFYYRQYRQRTGSHHNIITSGGAGDSGLGQRIATFNTLAEDYPKGGIIAPENKGVGIRMSPRTRINVSLHSINTSDKPMIREVWVNFWYRDAAEVTDPVYEVFTIAQMGAIPPGADVVVKGACTTSGAGRLLWAYGHRHANNTRFTVWHSSAGKKELVYQGYHWEEPMTLDFSSTVMNPMPDLGGKETEGGWSGVLPFKAGDQFQFECHIVNKTMGTLNFTNNTYTGEMCILDAETVGAGCK